jgi:enoyl-CoA hydratase
MTDNDQLKMEIRPDGVGVITLGRPDRLNAISTRLADQILEAISDLQVRSEVRAVVLTGEGKVFCAGADIAEFGELKGPLEFNAFLKRLGRALDAVSDCPKPTIAAVHGVAFGGGLELALACDILIAEEGTRLGLPEIKLGVLPGAGGTARLPRRLPLPVAKRMILTGEPIGAAEAQQLGLVAQVATPGETLNAALEFAAKLAALAPVAVKAAKSLLATGPDLSLDAALELERQTVSLLFATADREEGVAAFLEKRQPSFRGE